MFVESVRGFALYISSDITFFFFFFLKATFERKKERKKGRKNYATHVHIPSMLAYILLSKKFSKPHFEIFSYILRVVSPEGESTALKFTDSQI